MNTSNAFDNLTKTEYLFGKKKEEYQGLEDLAKQRIQDATDLLFLIGNIKNSTNDQIFIDKLIKRYEKVEEARDVWRKILEIEEYR
jgi:hypothetical protein